MLTREENVLPTYKTIPDGHDSILMHHLIVKIELYKYVFEATEEHSFVLLCHITIQKLFHMQY